MTQSADHTLARSAEVHVLINGYVDIDREPWSVASTVTYIRDGDIHVIVDPGLVPAPESILEPLREVDVRPEDITDVIFSHHHPDHTVNAALFPLARLHDHWAIYRNICGGRRRGHRRTPSPPTAQRCTPAGPVCWTSPR